MKTYLNNILVILLILLILLISCNKDNKITSKKTIYKQKNNINRIINIDSNTLNNSFDTLKKEFYEKDNVNKYENINYQNINEDFTVFFKKFKTEKLFQRQRIIYPLLITIEDEYESKNYYDNKIELSLEDSLNSHEVLYTIKQVNTFCFYVIIQVEDTGMNQVLVFKLDKNKWYLFQLIDKST